MSGYFKLSLAVLLLGWGFASPRLSWSRPAAAQPELKPSWLKEKLERWAPNLSILMGKGAAARQESASPLLRSADSEELQREFGALNRDFEWREKANIVDLRSRWNQVQRSRDLSKKVVGKVRNNQRDRNLKRAEKFVRSQENIRKPMEMALAVAAITSGQPLQTSLGADLDLYAFSNLPHGVNYLQLSSPLLTGSFTMNTGGSGLAGLTQGPPDWIVRNERYRLSLTRELPLWQLGDIGTGLHYGSSTESVTASVSKRLTADLSCELGSQNPISAASPLRGSEESVKVKYEVKF
ncbi:MAG: hypothetical protein NDJ89_12210 [Oligoflexia bacterium]|nr:hypothetical protein [Oligoflexia bacterium]